MKKDLDTKDVPIERLWSYIKTVKESGLPYVCKIGYADHIVNVLQIIEVDSPSIKYIKRILDLSNKINNPNGHLYG